MKKTAIISLSILLISNICNAQLKAPVQSDTLYIKSMKYNFNAISRENWPFAYVIQTTTSFIIDGKEFHIIKSYGKDNELYSRIEYTLLDGSKEYILVKRKDSNGITIEFSNYILDCSNRSNLYKAPSFQGGNVSTFSHWVGTHLNYPKSAKEEGIQGRVTVQFTVDKTGNVTNVSVLRGVDPSLDKEAVRVVSSSPKWTPGEDEEGNCVDVTYTFPLIFML